jgi:hypothetical protein
VSADGQAPERSYDERCFDAALVLSPDRAVQKLLMRHEPVPRDRLDPKVLERLGFEPLGGDLVMCEELLELVEGRRESLTLQELVQEERAGRDGQAPGKGSGRSREATGEAEWGQAPIYTSPRRSCSGRTSGWR